MRLSERLVPRSITTQIIGIVAISVFLGLVVTAAMIVFLYGLTNPKDTPAFAASRILNVTNFVQTARTPAEADIILAAVRNAGVQVQRVPISDLTPRPPAASLPISWLFLRRLEAQPGIDVLERLRYAEGPTQQLVVRLDSDYALIFDMESLGTSYWRFLVTPTTFVLVVVLAFMLLLSIYAVRRIISPLSAVAEAALSFGRSPRQDLVITSRGPREIVQLTDALNEMRTRIRALLEDRTRMLAAISHDLRTPLTRLRLRSERVNDEVLRSGMLGDLLKVSRMLDETLDYLREDGKFEAKSRADLPSLLQTICSDFADVGHDVTYDGPARLSWAVRPRALGRAVANIVENGIKHGSSVTVALRRRADSIEIEIADDGPGIPPALHEKVFDPFFKVDNARSQGDVGFGLGLSIAQDIVKRHGGQIGLQPCEPSGLAVLITLPADISIEASVT